MKTYEEYWDFVFGKDAELVVEDFRLHTGQYSMSTWLDMAEATALVGKCTEIPIGWDYFHERALDELIGVVEATRLDEREVMSSDRPPAK